MIRNHVPKFCKGCSKELIVREKEDAQMYRARMYCDENCYPSLEDRFWAKVDKSGPVPTRYPELGNCWLWTANRNNKGYGQFSVDGKYKLAHRVAYYLDRGFWPEKCALHKCDGGSIGCVRATHLADGSVADNNRDMIAKGRNYAKTSPEKLARGSKHGLSKLTEDDVICIRSRVHNESQTSLALEFGVTQGAICAIVHGRSWAWLKQTNS